MSKPRIPRERLLVIAVVLCLGLLIADRLVITPLLNAWRSNADAIADLRQSIAQGNALLDQEARVARWEADMQARYLPATPSEAEGVVVQQLDGWARASGLRLTGLRPNWKRVDKGAPQLELQLSGSGSIAATTAFLHSLESAPLAIAVDALELKTGRTAGGDLDLDLRLVALTADAGTAPKGDLK